MNYNLITEFEIVGKYCMFGFVEVSRKPNILQVNVNNG